MLRIHEHEIDFDKDARTLSGSLWGMLAETKRTASDGEGGAAGWIEADE